MHLLITGGRSAFAQIVAATLAAEHTIRLCDTVLPEAAEITAAAQETAHPITRMVGDIRQPEDSERAVEGIDAILHFATLAQLQAESLTPQELLDYASRGTFVLMNAARAAGVGRILLGSTLAFFKRMPWHWRVNETWRPRPEPAIEQLAPWIAELATRESTRVGTMQALCLRFGQMVDDAVARSEPYDRNWLHMDDAVAGVRAALAHEPTRQPDWKIFHITAPGPYAKIRHQNSAVVEELPDYQPTHDFADLAAAAPVPAVDERPWRAVLAPTHHTPSRPIRNVLLLGAGGPMGVVTTQELLSSYTLHVTDLLPLAEIAAAGKPQGPGAPLPIPVPPPHTESHIDVRDADAVAAAAANMDAIINCTVIRHDLANAFLVNTIGAYNVMQAAVAHGIRRVVHTGPLVQHLEGFGDYSWDFDIPVDAPGRAFDHQYIHSKYLGQEICRVFAEAYDLEVPVLLFCALYNPDVVKSGFEEFTISWADTGRALRRALEVTELPSPYEMVNISADLPHSRFDHRKAQQLLNWQPRDGMEHLWQAREA